VNQIIYKCLNDKCNCEFKATNKDGLRCPKCDNSITYFNLNPTQEELSKILNYKEIKSKKENGITIKIKLDDKKFKKELNELELRLDRIIEKQEKVSKTIVIRAEINGDIDINKLVEAMWIKVH